MPAKSCMIYWLLLVLSRFLALKSASFFWEIDGTIWMWNIPSWILMAVVVVGCDGVGEPPPPPSGVIEGGGGTKWGVAETAPLLPLIS